MNARLAVAALAVAILACPAPALAGGKGTTNTILAGAAAVTAGVAVANYDNKLRIRRQELQEQTRRVQAYREWYSRKYRREPTDQQIVDWYVSAYGVKP